jgi:condensin complex subunit 3
LQITALQIITDILTQHGTHLLDTNPALLKVYVKALKSGSKSPEVQAAATVAVCKLMLGRVIQDSTAANELLRTLVVAYFDPSTQDNQGVRQTLSYFLPVYSFSRKENQDRMRTVALDALHALHNLHENLDENDEDSDMVSLSTIGAHLVDWTDPRKCYVPGDNLTLMDESAKKAVNGDVHIDFAKDILEKLNSSASSKSFSHTENHISNNISGEEKKVIAPLLGKLHVSPASSEDKIRELYSEVTIAVDDKLLSDATGRNALYKIHVSLGKIVNSLGEIQGRQSSAAEGRTSMTPEDRTVVPGDDDDEKTIMTTTTRVKDEESDEEQTVMIHEKSTLAVRTKPRDSLVEELLSDDEDIL